MEIRSSYDFAKIKTILSVALKLDRDLVDFKLKIAKYSKNLMDYIVHELILQ